jgi:hypothetical protein
MKQVAILVFSGAAIFLVASRNRRVRRWGYLSGMASQPFYLWETFAADQWGMFMLCFWYSFSWSLGAWNHWRGA